MKRVISAIVLAFVLMVSLVGQAAATSVSSLTVEGHGELNDSKTAVTVTGSIICDLGSTNAVSVVIVQSSGKVDVAGSGETTVTCNGGVQTWSVVVNVLTAPAFKKGPAVSIFSANDTTTFESFPTQTQGIKIS